MSNEQRLAQLELVRELALAAFQHSRKPQWLKLIMDAVKLEHELSGKVGDGRPEITAEELLRGFESIEEAQRLYDNHIEGERAYE